MRPSRWLIALVLGLAACSSVPTAAGPPPNFPDLNAFHAVDPADYQLTGTSFLSPNQIDCVLDFGPHHVTVCSGDIPAVPESVTASGCSVVRKADPATGDAPYVFERSGQACATSHAKPMTAGSKLSGKNGTCAVGDGDLVACIDADMKHGFVLQPSGSWAF
jgi:hypothetical protein